VKQSYPDGLCYKYLLNENQLNLAFRAKARPKLGLEKDFHQFQNSISKNFETKITLKN